MKMNKLFLVSLSSILLASCKGQNYFGADKLILKQTIPLPKVKGRIDHLDINLRDKIVYIAALGNNSLEAADITQGKLIHSIKGLDEPQGVIFIPLTNEIMVANGGDGSCRFYNKTSFENTGAVDLGSDADDVRYDPVDKVIYVGYGSGGIAIIDPEKHQKTGDVRLSAHPEGFQIDKSLKKIFVNVPGANQIEVVDLKNLKVEAKWKTEYGANFPMAIDETDHIIFIGFRHPAKLVAIDVATGRTIASASLTGDTDDLYYDNSAKKIYASGGSGAIDIFLFQNPELKHIARIATRMGARTSFLIPEMQTFVLAERASGGEPAALKFFTLTK